MDLDFRIILEKPTREDDSPSIETQLTVAYMKAMRSGNLRQAEKIVEEQELIKQAREVKAQKEINNKEREEKLEKLRVLKKELLKELFGVRTASIDTLEDTLELRSQLYHLVKSDRDMASKRFIVANNFLEEAVISGASTSAPLTMIKAALNDFSELGHEGNENTEETEAMR